MAYDRIADKGEQFLRGSFGFGSPAEQMVGSAIIILFLIASSSFSLGATLALVPVFVVWFILGVFRLWGPVDRYWYA